APGGRQVPRRSAPGLADRGTGDGQRALPAPVGTRGRPDPYPWAQGLPSSPGRGAGTTSGELRVAGRVGPGTAGALRDSRQPLRGRPAAPGRPGRGRRRVSPGENTTRQGLPLRLARPRSRRTPL